jgi:signal peptidase I
MAKFLRFTAWTLLIIGALIGVLRLTAIRWWQLPVNDPYFGASITPTLHGGDWVVLWRATSPSFGDLVLCPEPKTGRPVIGRIVGEQGDHLKIEGTTLTVNRTPIRSDSGCDKFRASDPANGVEVDQSCSLEALGGRTHARGNVPADTLKALDAELDVPNGTVALVSDNRLFPYDSRDFGVVDRSTCAETVLFRLASKDGFFDVANRLTLIH